MAVSLMERAAAGNGKRKRVLYHLSQRYLGSCATFTPRIPRCTLPDEDRTVPRICASPTVTQAWQALGCDAGLYYVYVFDGCSAYKPTNREVPDVELTDEHWITAECEARMTGILAALVRPDHWPRRWQAYYSAVRARRSYCLRVARTLDDLQQSLAQVSFPYVAFSGGKDSLALLLLLRSLNRTDIPVMTQVDDLDWPWKRAYCEHITRYLGYDDVTFAESSVSAKSQLAEKLRSGESIRGTLRHVIERYVRERRRDSVIMGLRHEESRARRYGVRSTCYRTRSGMTHICPLAYWRAEEVVAYIALHNVPLAPVYCGGHRYPHEVRMSWPVVPDYARHGQAAWLRAEFSYTWHQLASEIQELRDIS